MWWNQSVQSIDISRNTTVRVSWHFAHIQLEHVIIINLFSAVFLLCLSLGLPLVLWKYLNLTLQTQLFYGPLWILSGTAQVSRSNQVSTRMGDHLIAGKPPCYVTSYPVQLSLQLYVGQEMNSKKLKLLSCLITLLVLIWVLMGVIFCCAVWLWEHFLWFRASSIHWWSASPTGLKLFLVSVILSSLFVSSMQFVPEMLVYSVISMVIFWFLKITLTVTSV